MKKICLLLSILFFCGCVTAQAVGECSHTQMSLEEAILLAIRSNPNVQIQQLNLLQQKFNLFIEEWKFTPQYTLQLNATAGQTANAGQPIVNSKGFKIEPGVNLLTPVGTKLSLTAFNNFGDHYNPGISLAITQPLIRNFGRAIVESALYNARDSLVITRLNVQGTLQSTVTEVIHAYLNIINAEKTLEIDRGALTRAEKSVEQTKLFIKAGRKAGNELVTVEANVASARSKLENDKNNVDQARYAMLAAIGIDPNTPIDFSSLDLDKLIKKYCLPTLDETKQLVLENDIQYQNDQITLQGVTKRTLMTAENHALPELMLNVNASTGKGSGGGWNSGINSLFNGANRATGIGLTLDVPIDNQLAKQSILSAKIALKTAQLSLKKEKWQKETSAINNWHNVLSAKSALSYAEDAERLQQKTYNISYQKYIHGLIDSLELQTAQVQLIQSEQALLSARIAYLKALVDLDQLTGHTLETWDIHVRL